MPSRGPRPAKGLLYVLLLSGLVYGVQFLLGVYWPTLSIYGRSALVFFAAKVVGDGLFLLFYSSNELVFGEDFVREAVVFAGVGLVAGAAIDLAIKVVGGPVTPALPAVGGYLVYGFASRRG